MNNRKISHILLIVVVFIAGVNLTFSQTIDNVTLSSYSICKPATINVTYRVTNGNGSPKHFTSATNYTIDFGTLSGNTFTIIHSQNYPAPNNFPSSINGSALNITKSFSIPETITDGINYQVIISATNPTAGFTLSSLSPILEVKSKLPSPTVSNNGPLCSGTTLSLSSSAVMGATYNWSGPNGFTSNQQNPVVSTNATEAMSGSYTLTLTSTNGCSSIPVSTNVVVYSSVIWTGSMDTNWNNPSNWGCGIVPNQNTNVDINSGLTNYPVLNTGPNASVKNITLATGSSLSILNNTLEISGIMSSNGSIDSQNGSITFTGGTSQDIPANTFVNNRIENININNASNVNLLGPLEISGIIKVTSGNLNSGGFLTLVSNSTKTALIDGSGTGQVSGSVTMQRFIDPAFGYKYLSSPFSNTVVGDYQTYVDLTTNFPNFYKYTENRNDGPGRDATGWEAYTNLTSSINVLNGYALNFGNSATPKTVSIAGIVNNGNQQINLRNTNGTYTQGFNLIGNPYPSPIDWNSGSGWTKFNVDNALYFFTASATDQYTGTYSSYVNGVQSADGLSSNIIPSMQGFFVHVSDLPIYPVDATLGMTNAVRVANFDQQFLKTPEEQGHWLMRISSNIEQYDSKDYMVLYSDGNATSNFDKNLDALKLMNTDTRVPNLYGLTSENKKISIKALSNPGDQPIIFPLGISTEDEGWHYIQLEDLQNIPSNLFVYLIDNEKRIGQNLLERTKYRFVKKEGVLDSRFHLLLSNKAISDPAIAFEEPFSVKSYSGKVMVSTNLKENEVGTLLVSTISGNNLYRRKVTGKQLIEVEGIKSSGVYIISMDLEEGIISKKVLINK